MRRTPPSARLRFAGFARAPLMSLETNGNDVA
jgi:hypothetical protein